MTIQIEKTPFYDMLIKSGEEVLHTTLTAAADQPIDQQIRQDLDQLMSEMSRGIIMAGGTVKETAGMVRLIGYLRELSYVAGMMPAFGFRFSTKTNAVGKTTLQVAFKPRKAAPAQAKKAATFDGAQPEARP